MFKPTKSAIQQVRLNESLDSVGVCLSRVLLKNGSELVLELM